MKKTLELMAAPTSMQPGGYIPTAFQDRTEPTVKSASIDIISTNKQWEIIVSWECPKPISDTAQNTNLSADALAIMVPVGANTPWATMGTEDKPVEAIMWRANKDNPTRLIANGLGTTVRSEPPPGWRAKAKWHKGIWTLHFNISNWPALSTQRQLSVAIWQGDNQERGGLKSVSGDWLTV